MHFITVKLKDIKLSLVMILVMIMLSLGSYNATPASVFFGYSTRLVPIYAVEKEEPVLAISFDAAWGADKTEAIIELLKEYQVGATFFLVGFWAERYPELVKKIHQEGFELGTHSNTHPDMSRLGKEQIIQELQISKQLIENLSDAQVELFRPPFGAYNNLLLQTASELNLKSIQWDVDSLDWKGLSAMDISLRVLNRVKPGSIVLFHNNADNIVEALRIILDRLTKQGYKITSIGNLLLEGDYYIDGQGLQRKK